jgi:uncharacterized protein (DUF983 family)
MDRCPPIAAAAEPGRLTATRRGFLGRCPACGRGRLFGCFLKVADRCGACGTEFHHHRADDFPPYIVMFLVGHVAVYGILQSETRLEIPLWVSMTLWPTLAVVLALALLQPVKGAVVGLQFALGMHGFGAARTAARASGQEEAGDGHAGAKHHRTSHLNGT